MILDSVGRFDLSLFSLAGLVTTFVMVFLHPANLEEKALGIVAVFVLDCVEVQVFIQGPNFA